MNQIRQMNPQVVYSKTAKGMAEFMKGGRNLAREQARVLSVINGKASVADLMAAGELTEACNVALEALVAGGMIRVFESGVQRASSDQSMSRLDADDAYSDVLPTLEVQELSPQESVEIWAAARRGASELKSAGFYSYGKSSSGASVLSLADDTTGLNALVVEDDQDLAELLTVLLSEKGMSVTVAADMRQALLAIQRGAPPDLVLLDVVLPGQSGKDGFDLLSFIRGKPEWARVPVVMVTSEVSDDQVMKGLKAGADGYIFKPFKWEALYGCIKNLVGI